MIKKNEESSTADREITLSRTFDAPRELVWDVWTDAKHIAQWWGPAGFTNTFSKFEVRVGGVWRFVMHGPDGHDYPNQITFIEVRKPERLVYAHRGEDGDPVNFHVTVTFDDLGGKTKLTMTSLFDSAEKRDYVIREYGALEGGKQMLERLAEFLAKM